MRRDLFKSGRCRNHAGMSTGPTSEEGKRRVTMNLPQFRKRALENATE
jgi:hypothetical protein